MRFFSSLFGRQPEGPEKGESPTHGGLLGLLGLTTWFNSLTREMQDRIRQYSGEGASLDHGEVTSSITQKSFFCACAEGAICARDFETAVFLAKRGLDAKGSWVDQHFVYSALIEAYVLLGNLPEAKRYCLDELRQFGFIRPALKKDMGGGLPPRMRFLDTLLDLLPEEGREGEIKIVMDLLVDEQLIEPEEARDLLREMLLDAKEQELLKELHNDKEEHALDLMRSIIKEDKHRAAGIYKSVGTLFLEKGNKQSAFEYLNMALAADPNISGVRRNLQKLAKELKIDIEIKQSEKPSVDDLRRLECTASEWWAKRDLADEYVRAKLYDDAWRLFNQAIILRLQGGGPCDTIYPHMAKMREKEGKYLDALTLYLLGYQQMLGSGRDNPTQYLEQAIDRCLGRLGLRDLGHDDMLKIAKEAKDTDTLRNALFKLNSTRSESNKTNDHPSESY